MEFLEDLGVPARPISQEIDLASVPGLGGALDGSSASTPPRDARNVESLSIPAGPADDDLASAPERGMSLPPLDDLGAPSARASAPPAKSEQELLAERRLRLSLRVQTCRDAFRMLGFLGIDDASRKGVARMLMALEATASTQASAHDGVRLVKDPDAALASAGVALLGTLETDVARVEDKLIQLDERVSRQDFERRVRSEKHPRRLLARYGRLLASRRLPAGERRDRFEWLATQLLTSSSEGGRRVPLSREAALPVLQHLIGGLQQHPDPDEQREALTYLREAQNKLETITTHTAFFDGGFFLDLHGYKISVRDQLLSPDFLYLSATLNAEIENRIEGWIAQLEREHKSNRLTPGGPPRQRITTLLKEQEEAVDKTFGVRRRRHAPEPTPSLAPAQSRSVRPNNARASRGRQGGSAARVVTVIALLLAIAGAGIVIADSLGVVRIP